MKRIFILFLLLLPAALQAQSLGQVKYGDRIFSTGLPEDVDSYYDPETGEYIKMSKERREAALECIERTFGKVASYEEGFNECAGAHFFDVTLTSGDEIGFDNGHLHDYTIGTPQFLIAADMFVYGLRVGQKPNMKCKEGVVLEKREDNPVRFSYYFSESECEVGYFTLDEDGKIKEIGLWINDC